MSKEFWESRWVNKQTGWDLEQVSPPIKAYIDQLEDKELKILIPGCGNAYEAEYLFQKGFKNVAIVEISQSAIDSFINRCPHFPKNQIHHIDFFKLNNRYDMLIEQTFFCAITPNLREAYVKKVADLLLPGGRLVGVLFNRSFQGGPPFGGSISEYHKRFAPLFEFKTLETCNNSVAPRQGSEVFINLRLK